MAVWVKVPVPGPEEAYYWNPETQATSWRAPDSVEVVWVAQRTQQAQSGNSKTMYFWNKKTREVTWEPPVSNKGPATSSTSAAPSPASAPCPASGAGRPTAQRFLFEVNPQYSGPGYDSGNATSRQPPFQEPDDGAGCSGGEWVEVVGHDGSPGRNFFMNFKQGTSLWSLPHGQSPVWRAYQHAAGPWYYVHVVSGQPAWTVADVPAEKPEEAAEGSPNARWIQAGAGMMVQGLSLRSARYNYQVGTVLGRRPSGRVAFQLPDCQGGTILDLWPRNVAPLEEGALVEIKGLTSNSVLNGVVGTVVGIDSEKCRYIVKLPPSEHHGGQEKAVRATKVLARTRLWDLDVTLAPTWLQWRKEQDCLFVDSGGYHRHFSVHLPLCFATAAREAGRALIRWPMILYMHGAGGSSFLRHSKKSLQSVGLNHCADNFVVVSPHCDWNWKDRPKPWVTELVVALRAAEWIDHQRIYLTGCSMGGMGTWEVGAEQPDLFAAVAPVAGHHNSERTEHIARRLRSSPVFVIHSLHDGVCPHAKEMPLWTLLKQEGNQHLKVSLAHHVDHTCMFERAYCDDSTIYEWLLQWSTTVE